MSIDHYRTLGRSGLVVSPLALGTMTFGTARWGSDADVSRAVFDGYVEVGGNFIDTADVYSGGRSETMLGDFIAERGWRDRLVLATKAGFGTGGLDGGGSSARHLNAAIDKSLQRLRTDHVDLFWLHVWDGVTPAEEVLEAMAGLVRAGKARYWGLSNVPAWFAAKLATLAAVRGLPGPIGLQYFHSLVDRMIEDEHVPLAAEFGIGIVPWSPLAYGLLTGKYERAAAGARSGANRLDGANPFGNTLFTERNWEIVEVLRTVAADLGETMARVALAWVVGRRGVTSTLLGVSSAAQLQGNIAALELELPADAVARLDAASSEARGLYGLFSPAGRKNAVFGGMAVSGWPD